MYVGVRTVIKVPLFTYLSYLKSGKSVTNTVGKYTNKMFEIKFS